MEKILVIYHIIHLLLIILFLMNIKNVFVCSENQELRLDGAYKAPAERGG